MSTLGNILWFLLGGFLIGLGYIIAGLLFCITIIGIPFGVQLMKIGVFTFCPLGKTTIFRNGQPGCINLVLNIIWILCGWIEIALAHVIVGALLCITVVGIPFGLQHFKIARLSLFPFGQSRR
ncbi:MAG: YccF domain-containing protein [Muribaculaceae bacterium]|nr:YccF domain-containing protein [Muribaculaceae bacterium]MCF0220467.1 YccF domain-containing protein [Muribaculaceae bacterium]